jgi:hypothetical protein
LVLNMCMASRLLHISSETARGAGKSLACLSSPDPRGSPFSLAPKRLLFPHPGGYLL